MVHAGCVLCCWHSPDKDMNVRIFWVCVMECMCAQTGPQFILLIWKSFGEWSQNHVNSKGKIPLTRRLWGGLNLQRCAMQDSEPNTLSNELFCPPAPGNVRDLLTYTALFNPSHRSWPPCPWQTNPQSSTSITIYKICFSVFTLFSQQRYTKCAVMSLLSGKIAIQNCIEKLVLKTHTETKV